jgi:hypothetical protein
VNWTHPLLKPFWELVSESIKSPGIGPCEIESVAQSVEQRTFNPWVEGSSPSALTLDFSTKTPGSSKGSGVFS